MSCIEDDNRLRERVSLKCFRLIGVEHKYTLKFLCESFLASSKKGDKWP